MIENFKELWSYRALVRALVVRHLSLRYRGSLLGFLWSFLNPLFLMLVYSLVFTYYIRFSEVENYTVFLFCGLLPWIWVSSGLLEGTSSVVSSGHLITKSMFPAHLLPAVSVITNMVNFLLSLPLLFIFMAVAHMNFHLTLFALPLVVLLQFLFLLGISLALSSLNVHFRDVQHILANVLTLLFFLCPILYPAKSVPDAFKFTLEYNPLALFTIFYQNLVLEGVLPSLQASLFLLGFVVLALALGGFIYRKCHESFAELL